MAYIRDCTSVASEIPGKLNAAGIIKPIKPPKNMMLCTVKKSDVPNSKPDMDFESRLRPTDNIRLEANAEYTRLIRFRPL